MGGRGGSKKKSSGGGGGSSQPSNNNWQAEQQAKMQAQMDAARKAADAEKKRIDDQRKAQEKEQAIQAENQKAADFRRSAESGIQKNFQSMAENQQRLDQQAAQSASQTIAGGSGYNMATAQQQKIAAAGGVAGPAATNAPAAGQMGIPQAMASNVGTGGTPQTTNRFNLPTASGLQFGGM